MRLIESCPICDSTGVELSSPAFLHQLLIWRSTGNYSWTHTPTSVLTCNQCSYRGPQLRLDLAEEEKYYRDYRGVDYNNMRIHSMPWYQGELELLDLPDVVKNRIIGSQSLILQHVDPLTINSVLDYGGPRGIYIPPRFIKAKLYVYDRGTALPEKGRIKTNLPVNNGTQYVDFILCKDMMDCTTDPDYLMNNLKSFMTKKSWLYIEVKESTPQSEEVFLEKINYFGIETLCKLFEKHRIRAHGTHTYDGIIGIIGKLK